MIKKTIAFLLLAFFACSLTACGETDSKYTDEMFALDTFISFTLYDNDEELCKTTVDECKREITRLEKLLSATHTSSDVYKINLSDGDSVQVSDETAYLIKESLELSSVVDGSFDITVRELMSAWGFDTKEYKVPENEVIEKALLKTGYEKVSVDKNLVTLESGVKIDLGGVAKGYITEMVSEVIKNSSVSCAVVNMGGMIITVGEKESGEKFTLGVEHPDDNKGYFYTFETDEVFVSTSGAYQRYFEENSVRYHHILDSKSGKPAQSEFSSVTVVGKSGEKTDMLSTAFFVMGLDKTKEYLKENEDYEVIMLSADEKTLYVSESINGSLEKEFKDDINIVYI